VSLHNALRATQCLALTPFLYCAYLFRACIPRSTHRTLVLHTESQLRTLFLRAERQLRILVLHIEHLRLSIHFLCAPQIVTAAFPLIHFVNRIFATTSTLITVSLHSGRINRATPAQLSVMNKILSLIILCILVGPFTRAQENFDSVKVVPHKLTDHLYFLTGAGGNIGVLVGPDGTVIVDDQFAPLSNRINGAIKTIDPGDIRFVINTHLHGDHSGGNENFTHMGATVIAQENVRKRMSTSSTNLATKEVTPPRDPAAWPVLTFPTTMSVHLNGEDIELVHLDPAHTDGDVAIWFKSANVFHLGDMFVTYGYPYIDYGNGGSINGFISSLDRLIGLMDDKTRIIPGHGPVCNKADVQKFRDTLADIRDQTLAALKKGKPVSELGSLPIASKYDATWGGGFLKGKDFVIQVGENLKASLPPSKK